MSGEVLVSQRWLGAQRCHWGNWPFGSEVAGLNPPGILRKTVGMLVPLVHGSEVREEAEEGGEGPNMEGCLMIRLWTSPCRVY